MNVYADWPRPGDTLLFYQRARETLRLLPSMADSLAIAPGPFFRMTPDRMRAIAAEMIEELKLECIMTMTASIEATFQIDSRARARHKLNDHVSTALRRHLKKMGKRNSRIEIEDILDIWKQELAGGSQAIGNLKQVIEFRHWLAHGRYWQQKSGLKKTDPFDVWSRWEGVLSLITEDNAFPLE
jgi:hypothetical protein